MRPVKAVQQFMLGTVLNSEAQARQTLRQIKASGYEGIELCGFMIRKVPFAVKILTQMAGMPTGKGGRLDWPALLKESGLRVVGLHEDLASVQGKTEAVLKAAECYQTKYVVITGLYRFDFSDLKAVQRLAKDLNQAGERLKQSGIALLYHNHNAELRRVESGKTAYQLLIEETDPACVNFEFDSYWPTEAGADALSMMEALGSRMKLWHINDRGARVAGRSMTPILKSDSMELGYGNMELLPLLAQAKHTGVDAVILESHRNWAEHSPIESMKRSAAFLNRHL